MAPEEDTQLEAAILRLLLIEHPAVLTVAEVHRALGRDRSATGEDDIDRALDALGGSGLLNRQGGLVLPSRAALYFDRLALD